MKLEDIRDKLKREGPTCRFSKNGELCGKPARMRSHNGFKIALCDACERSRDQTNRLLKLRKGPDFRPGAADARMTCDSCGSTSVQIIDRSFGTIRRPREDGDIFVRVEYARTECDDCGEISAMKVGEEVLNR